MKPTLNYPPGWLAGFMAAAWVIAQIHAPLGDALLWPGRGLIVLGLLIMLWAALVFRRARTTIIPHQTPTALVETGPFRYSHNPIYLADLMILAGWAVSLGAPLALLLAVPFQIILTRQFIEPEESRLDGAIGEPFRFYCLRVRRWL